MRRLVGSLLLAVASMAPALAPAQVPSITLDFESFPGPDGQIGTADDVPAPSCAPSGICPPLGTEFASAGIVFVSGTLAQFGAFPSKPATNHFVSSSPPDVRLSVPVYGVALTSRSSWTATLYAFDAAGSLIASQTLANPTPGGAVVEDRLAVSVTVPIARFVVLAEGCVPDGPPCPLILNLDDFVLSLAPLPATPTLPVSGIPVPASSAWSTLLLVISLAAVAGWRRTRPR